MIISKLSATFLFLLGCNTSIAAGVVSRKYKFQKDRNNCVYKESPSENDCKGWVYKGTGHHYCVETTLTSDETSGVFPQYFFDKAGKSFKEMEGLNPPGVALQRYSGGEYPYSNNPPCSFNPVDCKEQKIRDTRLEKMDEARPNESCSTIVSWGDGKGCDRECETTEHDGVEYTVCYCGEMIHEMDMGTLNIDLGLSQEEMKAMPKEDLEAIMHAKVNEALVGMTSGGQKLQQ